jgi:hypothetical protein
MLHHLATSSKFLLLNIMEQSGGKHYERSDQSKRHSHGNSQNADVTIDSFENSSCAFMLWTISGMMKFTLPFWNG